MIAFLDTSALVKLYHKEDRTLEIDFDSIQLSKDLLMRYGSKGLRTLDSIQLSATEGSALVV